MKIIQTSYISLAGLLWVQALSPLAAAMPDLAAAVPVQDSVLWYRQPALKWTESLPMGNGHIGARVFWRSPTGAYRAQRDHILVGPTPYCHHPGFVLLLHRGG